MKDVYTRDTMCPKRNETYHIRSDNEEKEHIFFVLQYIYRTPSMSAKLPKMVLNRVDAIMDYWRKKT